MKLESLCEGAGEVELSRISDIFQTSSRLEQEFWEAAYTERAWPA